jgi:hypothetical protein
MLEGFEAGFSALSVFSASSPPWSIGTEQQQHNPMGLVWFLVFVRSLFHLLELLFCEVGHRVYANLENKHEN